MRVHRHLAVWIAFVAVAASWWGAGARAHAQPGDELPSETVAEAPSLSPPRPMHLYMDVGVRLSSAPDRTIMIEPALEVSRSVHSYLGLGLGISGGSAPLISGERHAFTVAPSLHAYGHVLGRVRGHALLGVAAQYRTGGRLPEGKTLALVAALGARVNLGLCVVRRAGHRPRGCITAGTEVRLLRPMTSGWLMNPAVLPRGASILSTSVTLGWEV